MGLFSCIIGFRGSRCARPTQSLDAGAQPHYFMKRGLSVLQ
jgi:hypothetical protein